MPMQRLPNATQRIVIALLVGIVAIPASSTALFLDSQMKKSAMDASEIRTDVLLDAVQKRAAARRYLDVAEEFQNGSGIRNDVLKPSAQQQPAGTEGAEDVSSLSTEGLSIEERELLRRYVRARACPESLRRSPIAGFYELCLAIVGSGAAETLPQGLLNHTAYTTRTLRHLTEKAVPGFKLRMEMLKQAADPATRRDPGALPGRPTNCVKSADCH